MEKDNVASYGVGLGSVLAVVMSWSLYHSFWWSLLDGFLGWFYILYYFFKYGLPS